MKILIVDDSMAMRAIVMRTLRMAGYSGHTFLEAKNGIEALDKINQNNPDLVLLDWNMPEMNGIDVLHKMRSKNIPTKVGFVTSEGTPEILRQAMDSGALFLITKPFTVETFQRALDPVIS